MVVSMGEQAVQTENPETSAAETTPRQKLIRRDLAQRLDAKLAEDVEAAPRAPDAWLERRLRTFERQMGSVEQRQDAVEKNARASAFAAEEAIKAMQATIAALVERVEAAEAKAKAAANELRTALNEATLRIQTVETVAHAALAENHAAGTPMEEPAPAEPPAEEQPVPAATDDTPHPDAALPEPPKSYLTEVRKSVAAATAAAAAAAEEPKPSIAVRLGLSRYFLTGIVMFALFAAGAGVAFSKGVSDGRTDAMSHRAPAVARTAAAFAATPLDRLTVRAQSGDPNAELAVGLRYLDAKAKDPASAFHWITLAAVHGQPVAQYRLALLYTSGVGTAADPSRALQWFEASALQGNRKAMHDLAIAYAEGQGAPKNATEAVRWFSRAAGYGYVDSEFDLAVLYERGDGVPQSLLDAYKWYAVASRQGDAESKSRMEALQTQLSADDLAAAEHAAKAFQPVPYSPAANVL
jgi:TPR repeat protein